MTTLTPDCLPNLAAETSARLRAAGALTPDGDGVGHALLSLHSHLAFENDAAALILALDLAQNFVPDLVFARLLLDYDHLRTPDGLTLEALGEVDCAPSRSNLHTCVATVALHWSRLPQSADRGDSDCAASLRRLIVRLVRAFAARVGLDASASLTALIRATPADGIYLPVRG